MSVATVSKIINGKDKHISEDTRQRVKAILQKAGYVSNAVARGLKTGKTFTLGYILPDITNPYFAGLARGIEDLARERGYSVVVCNTDNDPEIEERSLKLFKSRMVDGIIFSHVLLADFPGSVFGRYLDILGDIPTVFLDRNVHLDTESRSGSCGNVYVNGMDAIYKGTMALIRAGCKKIACISAREDVEDARTNGYYAALKQEGFARDDRIVYLDDFSILTGVAGMQKIMEADATVDGLICGNDMIALGAMSYLNKHAIRIPEQIKIVGMDDIPFSGHVSPPLATIAQPIYEMGREAANMLVNYIEDGVPLGTRIFDAQLIERETLKVCRS